MICVIDESQTVDAIIPARTTRLDFDNPTKQAIDAENLLAIFLRQGQRLGVGMVRIGWRSQMVSLDVLRAFPNLSEVEVKGRKIVDMTLIKSLPLLKTLLVDTRPASKRILEPLRGMELDHVGLAATRADDVSHLDNMTRLNSLTALTWPAPDLRGLRRVALSFLAVKSRQTVECGGFNCDRLRRTWVIGCTKLERFIPMRSEAVMVSSCNRLDLDTLKVVSELIRLEISSLRSLRSVEFFGGCKDLISITITACPGVVSDWSPLWRHPTLQFAYLASMTDDACIMEIVRRNRRVSVSNGNIHILRGRQVTGEEFVREMDRATCIRGRSDEMEESEHRDHEWKGGAST
jgi:hypothetical protein